MSSKLAYIKKPLFGEVVLSLVAFLFLIPQPYLTIPELDASWQVTLEEAFFKGWEFGTIINFTGGPLSFLYTPTSLGYYIFTQIFAESIVLILAIFLIFRSLRGQPLWHHGLILIAMIPCAAIGKDAIYLVSVAAGAFILLRNDNSKLAPILIPAFMALLGLIKFSFASLGFVCILTLVLGSILRKDNRTAVLLAGSFLGSFLLIWILIGQNPLTIPAFILNSIHISQGYLWNMHQHEKLWVLSYLLFLMLITSLPIFLITLANRKKTDAWFALILAAATIYLSWKAGTNRGGSHMSIFMLSATVTAFLIQPLLSSKKWSYTWIALVAVTYFSGLAWVYPRGYSFIGERVSKSIVHNLKFLASPKTLNHSYTRIIPMVLAERELPNFKARMGEGSVDVLHYQQAIALLNPFNFQPRPTVQNYPAYNHHLCQLNLEHIQTNPPDFIIVKAGSIDARYPYSDDTLYNREVFQHYKPSLKENGYLLLERRPHPIPIEFDSIVLEQAISSGQHVDTSSWSEDLLWLQIDYRPSFMHRVVAFFYKPEMLHLKVSFEDETHKYFRLVGGNLKDGFLLNPLLEGNDALETFLNTHRPEKKITGLSIHTVPGNTKFNTQTFGIKVSVLKSGATP